MKGILFRNVFLSLVNLGGISFHFRYRTMFHYKFCGKQSKSILKHTYCGYNKYTSNNDKGQFQCNVPICKKLCLTFYELLNHLEKHLCDGYEVQCPFSGCIARYNNLNFLKSHFQWVFLFTTNRSTLRT